jgi:hypothetical protein
MFNLFRADEKNDEKEKGIKFSENHNVFACAQILQQMEFEGS